MRALAATTLRGPALACFKAARYSVWEENSSCEKIAARDWPARTVCPVVLT
jgi:hypothetical protein